MQMSGDERYVLDEAQAEIKRLTAENARLRGEAKKWCDACGCADGANMALRADLAHVTAERDRLRETLEDCVCLLDNVASDAGDPEGAIRTQIAESSASIAACAPPASGEVKP
jgi:hypothetical protein